MLSIVEMDLDSGGMSDMFIDCEIDEGTRVMSSLELIPVVYTTRLDDMAVLKHPVGLHPTQVTERISQESKPILLNYPSKNLHSKKSFRALQLKLDRIYKNINLNEELDVKPDISDLRIDPVVIQKVADDAKSACKHIELLKLCKPFSIVVSRIDENLVSKSKAKKSDLSGPLVLGPLQTEDSDLLTITSSSEEDEPLTLRNRDSTLLPKSHPVTTQTDAKKSAKRPYLNFGNRLLLNGLLEMHDLYSKELHLFSTDSEGRLIDYYNDKIENASKYDHTHSLTEARLTFHNCCWVRRDECLQAMYPKVLMYSNYRFIRKQHMCPLGACVCCCRSKDEFPKLPLLLIPANDSSSVNPPPFSEEDIEIQALEDEIEKSIIRMSTTPRLNNTEWLRTLLSKPSTKSSILLERALSYEKPLPKKQIENRHLLTVKHESSQLKVLVFMNFATNLKEVYEVNSSGELQSYMKATCYGNTSLEDIKNFSTSTLRTVKDVCCWFNREEFVAKLLKSGFLQPTAAKFIRSRHMCLFQKCTCCCKHSYKKGVVLTDIKNPTQTVDWSLVQNTVKLDTIKPGEIEAAFPPLVSNTPVSKILSTSNNLHGIVASSSVPESICRIASVSSVSQTSPTTSNLLPPEQVKHIAEVVKSDDISGEVNTLISSILERFKDVRLTINSDGKVAAALNTPINTLTTVELKVLANILSYAQSQVNLLGLNSGMSLSSIINMKKNDTNTPNNTQNNTIQSANVIKGLHSQTRSTKTLDTSKPFPHLNQRCTKEAAREFFTESLSVKNQGFNDSFASFLSNKLNSSDTQDTVTPVIQNVFSLKKEDIDETEDTTSSTTLWYRKPGNQQTESTGANSNKQGNTKKRSQDTASTEPKRIRVLSPSKLGAALTNEAKIINTFYKPIPFLTTHNLQVGSLMPRGPLLSNTNFKVVVKPTALSGENAGITPPPESAVLAASGSERTLVVTPLMSMTAPDTGGNIGSQITVPVSVSHSTNASISTFTTPQALDTPEDDDGDCILGM